MRNSLAGVSTRHGHLPDSASSSLIPLVIISLEINSSQVIVIVRFDLRNCPAFQNFCPYVVDEVGIKSSKLQPIEFIHDRQLEFVTDTDFRAFKVRKSSLSLEHKMFSPENTYCWKILVQNFYRGNMREGKQSASKVGSLKL